MSHRRKGDSAGHHQVKNTFNGHVCFGLNPRALVTRQLRAPGAHVALRLPGWGAQGQLEPQGPARGQQDGGPQTRLPAPHIQCQVSGQGLWRSFIPGRGPVLCWSPAAWMFNPALNIQLSRAGRKTSWSPWVHPGSSSEMMGLCGSSSRPPCTGMGGPSPRSGGTVPATA